MSIFDPTYIEYEQDTKLKSLILNRLNKDKFDSMSAHSPDEIWFIQESNLLGQPIVVDTTPRPTKLSEFENDVPYLSAVSWSQVTGKPTIPSRTSQLTNDSGYVTSAYVYGQIATHSTKWRDWYQTEIAYVDYVNVNRADLNTGVVPTSNTSVTGRFRGISEGNRFVGTTNDNWRFFDSSKAFYLDLTGAGSRIYTSNVWDETSWYDISVGNRYWHITPDGGSEISKSSTSVTINSTIPLWLGNSTYNWGGVYQNFDCAGFKIYEGETLVKDYRPVLDPQGVACLYEEVAQEYVYPTNGTFTAHMYNE